MIVLDHDVEQIMKPEQKRYILDEAKNVILMPEDVEKGMFTYLKSHKVYNRFEERIKEKGYNYPYDVCFSEWTDEQYNISELKRWFSKLEANIDGTDILFALWIEDNAEIVNGFIPKFVETYNNLADKLEMDYIIG